MSQHADLEALSAYVDGEAPEWAAHVEGCAPCRASADGLRAVAAAVAAPVEPPAARAREAAIAAAVGDVVQRHASERRRAPRRRFTWQLNLAAVAAVVLGAVGLMGLFFTQLSSTDDETTTVAGPALEAAPKSDLAQGGSATADSSAVTDLGDVRDAATLLARARPGAGSAAGSASSSAAAAGPSSTTFSARNAAPAPSVTGTRPCEEQARTREPALREVVYFAVARQGSTPAYVLGFSTGPAPAPVTLLLLAQNGCGELLRAAGP